MYLTGWIYFCMYCTLAGWTVLDWKRPFSNCMMWTTLFKRTVYVKTAKRLDNPVLACFFFLSDKLELQVLYYVVYWYFNGLYEISTAGAMVSFKWALCTLFPKFIPYCSAFCGIALSKTKDTWSVALPEWGHQYHTVSINRPPILSFELLEVLCLIK